ncbi:MAG TPA: hypothetical protein VF577_07050 [Allosphingosinicella sp.]
MFGRGQKAAAGEGGKFSFIGPEVTVTGDVDGNGAADLVIRVDAPAGHIFSAADFVL